MEIREWATRILSADTLAEKFFDPGELEDRNPGSPLFWKEPSRPEGMRFQRRSKEEKLPPFHELGSPDKRAVCLHRFAGHELLAIEMMAFALLAFPEAPGTFRRGVVHTLREEQEHLRLYIQRMRELNLEFGDLPLYKHFWAHTPYLTTPLHYISTVSLTMEMANLDFAPMYGKTFERFGDEESSLLMQRILQDEIAHVSFGWRWLQRWKESHCSDWEAWTQTQSELLSPRRAKGFIIQEAPRKAAGVSDEFIALLREE